MVSLEKFAALIEGNVDIRQEVFSVEEMGDDIHPDYEGNSNMTSLPGCSINQVGHIQKILNSGN